MTTLGPNGNFAKLPVSFEPTAEFLSEFHKLKVTKLVAARTPTGRGRRIQVWASKEGRAVVVRWDKTKTVSWFTSYNDSLGRQFSAEDFAKHNRIPLV